MPEEQHTPRHSLIGDNETYTVVLQAPGQLEFYDASKGPWEKRNVPDFVLTPDEAEGLYLFFKVLPFKNHAADQQRSLEERRDSRFFQATISALQDIRGRAMKLPSEERYSAGYGILRGLVEALVTNFASALSTDQLGEIRIVLDQLARLTREDEHLSETTKRKQDSLAQALLDAAQEA